MMSQKDFEKKQILFVFFNNGEKMSFQNENVVIKDSTGKIILQCSCYRLFLIYAVGNFSITNVLIQKADRYGFRIACLTTSFRLYAVLGAQKDGNTLLKRKQYEYDSTQIASYLVRTKIQSQCSVLERIRNRSDYTNEVLATLRSYCQIVSEIDDFASLRGYEGLASKQYFRALFSNVEWAGRQPRLKADYINSSMDIGYTILFSFIEALLASFGFDLYVGYLHSQFYMRKSLVCDLVEPFRPLIDFQIRKSINLKQIKDSDFIIRNYQYQLKYEKTKEYVSLFLSPLIDNREEIFRFILMFYRSFMKDLQIDQYPTLSRGVNHNGDNQL